MRHTTVLVCLIALCLPACWADFPGDLIEPDAPQGDMVQPDLHPRKDKGPTDLGPDGAPDLPGDQGLDGPGLDGPAPDTSPDVSTQDTGPVSTLKALGDACTADDQCYTNHCVDGVCCNSTCGGTCMRCDVVAGRCMPAQDGTDPDNECSISAANTCGLDGECNGRGGCRKWAAGTVCSPQSCGGSASEKVILAKICDGEGACMTMGEVTCSPYKCDPSTKACYEACTSTGSAQCVSGNQCISGKCGGELKPDGASCSFNTDCKSSHCVDGVCCDSACSGNCKTCKLSVVSTTAVPPIAGKCIDSPSGMDPDGECAPTAKHTCGTDGSCDGKGACRLYQPGTVCQERLCQNGTSGATLLPFELCDGSGQCVVSGSPTSCGSFTCITGLACYGQCTSSSQCATGTCNLTTLTCQ